MQERSPMWKYRMGDLYYQMGDLISKERVMQYRTQIK